MKKSKFGKVRPVTEEVIEGQLQKAEEALSSVGEESEEVRRAREFFSAPRHAKYKIEIVIGSRRRRDHMYARVDFWMSASRMTGDGDDHMFLCGYPDCHRPFASEYIQGPWAVCPHCAEKGRNNGGVQVSSLPESLGFRLDPQDAAKIRPIGQRSHVTVGGKQYPGVHDNIMLSCTPAILSDVIARYWTHLEGNADITVKFNPLDIRGRKPEDVVIHDLSDRVVVYSLESIVKDTSTGSDLVGRLKALLTA